MFIFHKNINFQNKTFRTEDSKIFIDATGLNEIEFEPEIVLKYSFS